MPIFTQLGSYIASMTAMERVGQAISLIAMTVSILSFQQRTQKRLVTLQLVSTSLFAVQFLLLGGITGFVLNVVGALRALVFANRDKPWAARRRWLWIFLVLSVGAGLAVYRKPLDLVPVAGMLFSTVALRMPEAKKNRLFSLPSSVLWIIYNLSVPSWGGFFAEILCIVSIGTAMIRLDYRPRKKSV